MTSSDTPESPSVPRLNAGLRALYSEEAGRSDWNTFKGWLDVGTPVRKGERGFPVWATPRALHTLCGKSGRVSMSGTIVTCPECRRLGGPPDKSAAMTAIREAAERFQRR